MPRRRFDGLPEYQHVLDGPPFSDGASCMDISGPHGAKLSVWHRVLPRPFGKEELGHKQPPTTYPMPQVSISVFRPSAPVPIPFGSRQPLLADEHGFGSVGKSARIFVKYVQGGHGPHIRKNIDRHEVLFAYQGSGVVHTRIGALRYRESDFVVIPKSIECSIDPKTDSSFLIFEVCDYPALPVYEGQERGAANSPVVPFPWAFDDEDIVLPVLDSACPDEHRKEKILLVHDNGATFMYYAPSPFSAVAWSGNLYPYAISSAAIFAQRRRMGRFGHRHETFVSVNAAGTHTAIVSIFAPEHTKNLPEVCLDSEYDTMVFYYKKAREDERGCKQGDIVLYPAGAPWSLRHYDAGDMAIVLRVKNRLHLCRDYGEHTLKGYDPRNVALNPDYQ